MALIDATAFAGALRAMMPERLVAVAGCVLWPEYDPPTEAVVEAGLRQLRDNYAGFTAPAALEGADGADDEPLEVCVTLSQV